MKLLVVVSLLLLCACDPTQREATADYTSPPELQDCKIFELMNTHGNYLTVVRCPNSTTSTISGSKIKRTAVLIDVVEYVRAN